MNGDEEYLLAERKSARWKESIETSARYFDKTGRLPSVRQMRYWFRGGKETVKLDAGWLEEGLGIAAEQLGITLAYRYTIVARIEGKDQIGRPYELEWTLQYYAPYEERFDIAIAKERRAAQWVLSDVALQHGSWIPDDAKHPNTQAERQPTAVVRENATLKITDATRTVTGLDGKETIYEKVFKINNDDVLRRIKETKKLV